MGKKDKKKKGKGAEKTATKTEKKATRKLKKELKDKGEEDIEKLIAEFQEIDKKRFEVIETIVPPPSPRSSFSLNAHPDKDELLLFGGEYYNGHKTYVYNDLFIYNLKKREWTSLSIPNGPPPRCAHQVQKYQINGELTCHMFCTSCGNLIHTNSAVALAQSGGQLWVFGGEFASPSQSQFYHYKDLWVLHLQEKKWEKISASGGPSPRSGHRMVAVKRQLMIFGGFHDNTRDYKYFNDVHIFNLDTYKWDRPEISGRALCPRSGCLMAPLSDGRVLVGGGYSKDRVKKDVDSGKIHDDMFMLQQQKGDSSALKWRWVQVKQTGSIPSPRCGSSMANAPNDRSYIFGGVFDQEDDEEQLEGVFHDDLHQLELDTTRWTRLHLSGNKKDKKRRRKPKGENDEPQETKEHSEESEDDEEVVDDAEKAKVETKIVDDSGIFTVTIGPSTSSADASSVREKPSASCTSQPKGFWPPPRINAGTVVKHGVLYLYGGVYEDGDKQITLDDFYSLDLKRLDEWKVLVEGKAVVHQEWLESDSSDGEDDDGDEKEDEDDDAAEDEQEEEEDDDDEAAAEDEEDKTAAKDTIDAEQSDAKIETSL